MVLVDALSSDGPSKESFTTWHDVYSRFSEQIGPLAVRESELKDKNSHDTTQLLRMHHLVGLLEMMIQENLVDAE
ncbi:Oidioi.mRNA.OKI2018_I69.chr2.g5409.t1.cds [Oikopleura dioica]|uniref:Oidioi.mRNA.OKI2018_I69.chr2.g5409.t1.cds n=1 Tax=Oikopleura dioica TaxID=34765 RepID=A0ABN7T001_OIKDI|nr:Oidioi.mRNA.OKI2018_I69.chr2.g5409.t1.cds [Oikopleura dioica]